MASRVAHIPLQVRFSTLSEKKYLPPSWQPTDARGNRLGSSGCLDTWSCLAVQVNSELTVDATPILSEARKSSRQSHSKP